MQTAAAQIENGKLLQHLLDLRRAMRECNCTGSRIDLSSDLVASGLRLLPKSQLNDSSAIDLLHEASTARMQDVPDAKLQSTAGQSLDSSRTTSSSSARSADTQRDPVDEQHAASIGSAKGSQQSDAQQHMAAGSRDASAARSRHEHDARRHGSQDLQQQAASD